MINKSTHKFSSGAMSIIQMGEEQIGHPSTAINELVKNGYDADADKCWVYTHYDPDKSKSFLIIKDNGLGMNYNTLFGSWLITSRSSKRDEDRDKRRSIIYERRFLGSKGIGRLAAMALGRCLTIVTKQKDETTFNWLQIDRDIFRVEGLLNEISFSGDTINDFTQLFTDDDLLRESKLNVNHDLISLFSKEPYCDFKEGTMIVLQDIDNSVKTILEEEFNYTYLEESSFYKSLVELITPLRLNHEIQKELLSEKIIKSELKISNGADTFELFYGLNLLNDVKEKNINFVEINPSKIIGHYDYRIFGKVTDDCNLVGKYICQRLEIDKRNEEFNLSAQYLLSDENAKVRNTLKLEDIPNKYSDVKVGEFYFDIRIYDLDEDSKEKMSQLLKAKGRREVSQIMNKYLGIKISKNGFGVKPYGEEGQDWLGLGVKRVNKHIVSIGPNQVLGYTFLYSPQNDGLNEKTNREGFFESRAFIVFKKIITGILEEAGQRRAKYRLYHGMGRGNVASKLQRPDSEKFIQYLSERTNDIELLRLSQQFIAETNTALDNMEESLSFSQRLATLGTGLELVYHELSQPLTAIGGSLTSLNNNIKKVSEENLKRTLEDRSANIKDSISTIEDLRNALKPAIGKSKPQEFGPINTFKKVLHLFRDKIDEDHIIINISKSLENYTIIEVEYPFWIAFLNIINNAMYWLAFTENAKIINFELIDSNTLRISNTSPKIAEQDLETIFGYGITGKKERNATGLGLSFTKNMLENIDWEIWAQNLEFGPAFYIRKK